MTALDTPLTSDFGGRMWENQAARAARQRQIPGLTPTRGRG